MYARVQVHAELPAHGLAALSRRAGFREGWILRRLARAGDLAVTLWDTRADAELTLGLTDLTLAHDEVYQVRQADDAISGDREPGFASVMWLDGPRSEVQAIADERAGRERAWPAIREVPGLIRLIALYGADRSLVVLALTTDADTIDTIDATIRATPLLPGEDPAMLNDPDRVDVYSVVAGVRTTVVAG